MEATGYQKDSAAMVAAVNGFDTSAGDVRAAMSALDQELQDSLSKYSGVQAQAFWKLMEQLQVGMTRAGQELDNMSTLVSANATNYDRADEEVADEFGVLTTEAESSSDIFFRLSGTR